MFGCSCTVGIGLAEAETVTEQLSTILNRPVINIGVSASSLMFSFINSTLLSKNFPTPNLRGGGLSRVPTGSKLGLHTDFNWIDQLQLNRKVNLILYLTPNWSSDWNGNLEFWNFENTECQVKIEPKANRLAIWNYDPRLVHGLSGTLSMPPGTYRDNLIHFYYTSNATWEIDPKRSQFY